ncbi:MAG: MarR family transcriptional regulator [Chloroflexota bacterium]
MEPSKVAQQSNYSYLPDLVGHLSSLLFVRATDIALKHLAELNLTTKEFVTLEFVANNPQASQTIIARETGTKPTLLVKILDDLTQRGLLIREQLPHNRRRHQVRLTDAGEQLRDRIRELAFAADEELLEAASFSAEEKQALLELLRKLTDRA